MSVVRREGRETLRIHGDWDCVGSQEGRQTLGRSGEEEMEGRKIGVLHCWDGIRTMGGESVARRYRRNLGA